MSNTKFLANIIWWSILVVIKQYNNRKCHFDNNTGYDNGGAFLVFDGS